MSELIAPVAIYGLGNAADLWTTEDALSHGARELNPLGQDNSDRLALKLGSTFALLGADLALQKIERRYVVVNRGGFVLERRKPTVAKLATGAKWALRGLAAAYYAQLAIKNAKVAREMRGAR
jgi:hypothetical protein